MKASIELYQQRVGQTQAKVRFQPASVANTPWGRHVSEVSAQLKTQLEGELADSGADGPLPEDADKLVGQESEASPLEILRGELEDERSARAEDKEKHQAELAELRRQLAAAKAEARQQDDLAALTGDSAPRPSPAANKPKGADKAAAKPEGTNAASATKS